MHEFETSDLQNTLQRIADALERMAPAGAGVADLTEADCFVFDPPMSLRPVRNVNRVSIDLLQGIDRSRDMLLDNTQRFARSLPANNALLWGARGMGKSSLVKAAHASVNAADEGRSAPLKLVEIAREDIERLPDLMGVLRDAPFQILLFCDDLSFDVGDSSYKSLKAVLEGGVEGRPRNVLFYATSNRRHLLPRDMIENERATAINPGESVEEKVSLSDRFGLWIGFHNCSQEDYLTMVAAYADRYDLAINEDDLRAQALEWQLTRGSRSGRVAFQFIQDLAGRLGRQID
ncbi:ATP-binding protein [Fulvimarina endophytica]|uniref:ATP-binding protein n=1 Tax=Fulvimarina endophytica TaxID=2293836 RepID=A0A371XAV8_9HYPH|nr:ATP-binding protein [Fulvimarina endophytica]RFC66363.1 ATP-binding protein [Fulvimarina endophytica]